MKQHLRHGAWQFAPVFLSMSLMLLAGCSTYRGDSSRSGQSPIYAGSNALGLKWSNTSSLSASAGPYLGTPLAPGVIFMADKYGAVYSIKTDGTQAWSFPTGLLGARITGVASDSSALILSGSLVDVTSSGVQWTFTDPSYEVALSTDVAFANDLSGTIYIGDECGVLYALNPNGTLKWSTGSCTPGYYAPTISTAVGPDGTIYYGVVTTALGGGGGGATGLMLAVSPTGKSLWSEGLYWGTPSIGGPNGSTMIMRSVDSTHLYALTVSSKGYTFQWQLPAPVVSGQQLQFSLPAIATDGSVYVGTSGAGLWKINASGAVVWQTNPGGAADFYSPPTIGSDGRIYVVGYAAAYSWNMLLAVGPATGLSSAGSLLCGGNKGAPNKVNAPMIGSDGTIYMISDGVPVTGPPECPLEAFH